MKGKVSLPEWNALKAATNYCCYVCRRPEPEIKLTPDHSIPLSRGGTHTVDNIRPLCLPCNMRKGVNGPQWYKEQLLKRQFEIDGAV